MITSLGSGMIELSMAINSAISGYPPVCSLAKYQSIRDLNMGPLVILENLCEAMQYS